MARKLAKGGPLELNKSRYGVGLSWDKLQRTVDLDLQAVLVNEAGTIIDAVYYNKLEAMDRAIAHSGDEQTGAADGLDETIWVNLAKLSQEVRLIIFVVAVSSGGTLEDTADLTLHVVEKWQGCTMESFPVPRSCGRVIAIALMARSGAGAWTFAKLSEEAEEGGHFMDILEPTLGGVIRRRIRNAPKVQRVNFPMRKGAAVEMSQCSAMKTVAVSVGWDMEVKTVDLDVSAVFFDKEARNVGAVYYDNKRQCGVMHTGDNQTGEGDGDDETINVDLLRVPGHILQIFFVVNIYTKDVTFDSLNNAYVRICDATGNEMMRFDLDEGCNTGKPGGSGLIIARLCRTCGAARWNFQAMGFFCPGRKWMHPSCISEMQRFCGKSPHSLEQELASQRRVIKQKEVNQKGGHQAPGTSKRGGVKLLREPSKSTVELHAAGPGEKALQHFTQHRGPSILGIASELRLRRTLTDGLVEHPQRIFVGVGWDVVDSKAGSVPADFDVSAVFFHKDGRDLGAVDYENPSDFGLLHSGDNTTGEGEGDDETITLEPELIPADVDQIFLVVTVYTKGMTFAMVENAYCRVVGEDGKEMCNYDLSGNDTQEHSSATALVIAQFYRHPEQGWVFKARGAFCCGRTWIDPVCIDKMKELFRRTKEELNPGPVAPQPPDASRPLVWRRQASKGLILGREVGNEEEEGDRNSEGQDPELVKGLDSCTECEGPPGRRDTVVSL